MSAILMLRFGDGLAMIVDPASGKGWRERRAIIAANTALLGKLGAIYASAFDVDQTEIEFS